jgi:hypothetical protein
LNNSFFFLFYSDGVNNKELKQKICRKNPNAGALTNFEVLDFLRSRGASRDVSRVLAPVAASEYKVVFSYLILFVYFIWNMIARNGTDGSVLLTATSLNCVCLILLRCFVCRFMIIWLKLLRAI